MRLRSKLTLTLVVLALVPLATATWVLVRLNLGRLELSAKEFRLAVADDVARLVRSTVTQARSELGGLGAALSQPNISGVERERSARNLLLGANYVHGIALYDRRGKFVMALRSEQITDHLPHPTALDDSVRGIARTEGVALFGVTSSGAQSPHLPLVQPVYVGKQRTLYGYLWTSINLRPVGTELAGSADAASAVTPSGCSSLTRSCASSPMAAGPPSGNPSARPASDGPWEATGNTSGGTWRSPRSTPSLVSRCSACCCPSGSLGGAWWWSNPAPKPTPP